MRTLGSLAGIAFGAMATAVLGQQALDLDIPNDAVQEWARDGDTLYIAGSFSVVSQHTGALAVSQQATGDIVPFDDVVSRQVDVVISDGQGGWIIGGDIDGFDASEGSSVAHVQADGTLRILSLHVNPRSIYDMALFDRTLFIAGGFEDADPVEGQFLIAMDLDAGTVIPWSPGIDDDVLDLEVADGVLYAAGAFGNAGGQPHGGLARFNAATLTLDDWQVGAVGRYSAISVHGDRVYYRGRGVRIQAEYYDHLVGAVSVADGAPLIWRPQDLDFSAVRAVRASDEGVYVGGSFERIGTFSRLGVALLSADDASVLPFRADIGRDQPEAADVHEVLLAGGNVLVEGEMEMVDGQPRLGVALLERETGDLQPWAVGAPHEDRYAVAADAQHVAVGGRFVGVNPEPRNRVAAIDLVSGRVLPFAPDLVGPSGSPLKIEQLMASDEGDGRVLIAGNFESADGIPVKGLIAVDAQTGRLVLDFDPAIDARAYRQMLRTPHGIVARGNGLIGAFVVLLDERTGIPRWITPPTVTQVGEMAYDPAGDTVIVSGRNETGDPATHRQRMMEFEADRGRLTSFDPDIDQFSSLEVWNDRLIVHSSRTMAIEGALRYELAAYQRTTDGWVFDPMFELGRPSSEGDISTIRVIGDKLLVTGTQIATLSGYIGHRGTLTLPDLRACTGQLLREPPELVRTIRDRQVFEAYRSIGVVWSLPEYEYLGTYCRVDLDENCGRDLFDFLAFTTLFDLGDSRADFDGDGELTLFDFLAFQSAFAGGC
ncbi:MAG: hypothetical protein ACIAS6_13775 [Phycisphaerales bacterium JB060]